MSQVERLSPDGESGLKYRNDERYEIKELSLPGWGEWVEI